MAAYDVEPGLHLLSRRRKARRDPREFASRRRRARPLPALSPARCGRPRLLRSKPTRAGASSIAPATGARALPPDQLKALVERYWAAVRLGFAFHRDLPKLAQ